MPYIPQFNRLSLQEMSYAPSLLRQQHDDAIAKQMELSEALKFDYLKQDAPGIEPILQKYSSDIDDISKQIAQNGFSQDLKSKVLGLRSKYVSDDKVRHYKKQYGDAMQGWEEQKKALIQKGASGDLLNKQKASYFGSYKGGFDDEGFKQEFNAGRTSGVYDPVEDTSKLMKNLGETGVLESLGNSSARISYKKDPVTGQSIPGVEIIDNNTGQIVENSKQISSMLNSMIDEYSSDKTDRGLWATISEQDKGQLLKTITDVANAHLSSRYAGVPQQSVRWSPVDNGSGSVSNDNQRPLPVTEELEVSKKLQKDLDKDLEIINQKRPSDTEYNTKMDAFRKAASKDPRGAGLISQVERGHKNEIKIWEDSRNKVISKYKTKYKDFFDPNVPVEQSVAKAIAYEKNNTATKTQKVHIVADPKEFGGNTITESILNYVFPDKDKDISIDVDGKLETKGDFEKLWDDKTKWKESVPSINRLGQIELTGPEGEKYTLNDNALDVNTRSIKNKVLVPMLSQLNDPTLGDNDSFDPIEIPNMNMAIDVVVDPNDKYNIASRQVVAYNILSRDANGNIIPDTSSARRLSPSDAMQFVTKGIFSGFKSVKF